MISKCIYFEILLGNWCTTETQMAHIKKKKKKNLKKKKTLKEFRHLFLHSLCKPRKNFFLKKKKKLKEFRHLFLYSLCKPGPPYHTFDTSMVEGMKQGVQAETMAMGKQ